MLTPELRWPITAATFASTSFCATVVPVFGSAWSSSLCISKVTGLPSMVIFCAFSWSTARRTPFSSSLPRCAMEPVSGPACATFTVVPAGAAGAAAFAGADFGSSFFSHAASASAAATAMSNVPWVFIGNLSWSCRGGARKGRDYALFQALLLGEHPLHELLDVGVAHERVRQHRHLAPDSLSAFLHFLLEFRLRALVALVLRGDFLVRRADHLLVDGMACHAAGFRGEVEAGI